MVNKYEALLHKNQPSEKRQLPRVQKDQLLKPIRRFKKIRPKLGSGLGWTCKTAAKPNYCAREHARTHLLQKSCPIFLEQPKFLTTKNCDVAAPGNCGKTNTRNQMKQKDDWSTCQKRSRCGHQNLQMMFIYRGPGYVAEAKQQVGMGSETIYTPEESLGLLISLMRKRTSIEK